ncbi:MAG: acyltransferase [Anaerolineaceae bacterium]|nr:acyltransferase [Anaerolineaceae bacterium]
MAVSIWVVKEKNHGRYLSIYKGLVIIKNTMRGRDQFTKYEILISGVKKITGLFPRSFVQLWFDVFRHTPGMFGFGMRYVLLARLAKRCGRAVSIYPGAYFLNIDNLEIGDYVSIHQMCYIEAFGGLVIGSNVAMAHGASIITLEHDFSQHDVPMRDAKVIGKSVVVEDDVWIGADAKILAGVVVERGSVIGAGAVVTRSVVENVIVAGVPAKVIGKR